MAVDTPTDGWLAVRVASQVSDSFYQPLFAHTSPVYVTTGRPPAERPVAAAHFDRALDEAMGWVQHQGRFHTVAQQREVLDLFKTGQAVYQTLRKQST